jgi:hypothetical protein
MNDPSDLSGLDLISLKKEIELLDSCPILKHGDGDYATLVDEQDPEKGVMICNKDGYVKMTMPLETYDEIMKLK